MSEFDAPRQALVIVAHPDDIDFVVAGTVATLTSAGTEVVYCLVTSGEAGAPDDAPREQVARTREAEQRAAAALVGVNDVRFLGYPDGHVEATLALRRDLSRMIREVKPDLIITNGGDRRWDEMYYSHPDHLAVGQATAAAVYPDSRNRWSHPELLDGGYLPHVVERMWVMGLETNHVVDITDVFDLKLAALRCHVSQVGDGGDLDAMMREWAQSNAAEGGLPEGRLAEVFRQLDTR